MNSSKYAFILLITAGFFFFKTEKSFGQEEFLAPVTYTVKASSVTTKASLKAAATQKTDKQIIFFDDFWYANDSAFCYPLGTNWKDKNVCVNRSFGYNPYTVGVATFDGLDSKGELYSSAETDELSNADTLTSKYINLSGYTPDDSLYFYFFYQPGGLGDMPETNDSLILKFYKNSLDKGTVVWKKEGTNKDVLTNFQTVKMAIKDEAFYSDSFYFRFINKVSLKNENQNPGLASNGDFWNIDYVCIIKNRTMADTAFIDNAIAQNAGSILLRYTSIPWKHYRDFFYKTTKPLFNQKIYNFGSYEANVQVSLQFKEIIGNEVFPYEKNSTMIVCPPQKHTDYQFETINLTSDETESTLFEIEASIENSEADSISFNNSSKWYQKFANYYAYDDGSAELGYGLKGANISGSMVALKYSAYRSDTLSAIDIYFNPTLNDENKTEFNLFVWGDNKGKPGDSIYAESRLVEISSGSQRFKRYILEKRILVDTLFYIGWQQKNEVFLNIGFDRNDTANNFHFCNFEGIASGWAKSKISKTGALMIRPVFGDPTIVSVKSVTKPAEFSVYPNPAGNYINLTSQTNNNCKVQIYSLTGSLVLSKQSASSIYVGNLKSGMYIVKLITPDNNVSVSRFIKR